MRRFTLLILLAAGLMTGFNAQAQLSILFVDDTDDAFGNAAYFASALDSLGYAYTYYNAPDSAAAPLDTYLAGFDLVIWHTSTDDGGLWFWNGLDEDNTRLKTYLDNGGNLWVVGNDFLFDRHGAPAITFQAGDFVYDYLGLSSYDVQAYGSDGGLGVPQASPDTAQPITGLDTITWQFATLWWADGVSLRDSATAIYRMGDASYVLADSVMGAWYDNGSSKVLSFFFDLSLANNFAQIKGTTGAVVSFFESVITDSSTAISNPLLAANSLKVFPNPVQDQMNFQFELTQASQCSAELTDFQGRHLATLFGSKQLPAGVHSFVWNGTSNLPTGTYFLAVKAGNHSFRRPVLVLR